MNHTKKASNKAGICTYRSSISIDENLEREFIAYIKECYLPDGGFSIPDEEIVAERLAGLFNQKVDVFEFMLVDSSLVIVIRFPESDCDLSWEFDDRTGFTFVRWVRPSWRSEAVLEPLKMLH